MIARQHRNASKASGGSPIALLLVPGTLCDAGLYEPLLERLDLGQREVRIACLMADTDVIAAAQRILAEAPQDFALVGFSLGGIAALEIASQAPERVMGLALLDSNARGIDPASRAGRIANAEAGTADIARYVGETQWPNYVGSKSQDDERLRSQIVDMALRVGPEALLAQTELALGRPDSRPRLNRLTMPALILAGAQDALCTPEMQQELASGLGDGTLVLLDGVGHFSVLEAPDAVAQSIAEWLARIDSAGGSLELDRNQNSLVV